MAAGRKNDFEEYIRIDIALDSILARLCRNPYTIESVAHLNAHCKRFWSFYHEYADIALFARQHQ